MTEIVSESASPPDRTRVLCQEVVGALMARGGWTSVREDELVDRVWREASPNAGATTLDRLAKYHYSALLYAACAAKGNPSRRELGFRDLHRFLYRAAFNRWPELAEDATQRALVLVYEQLDRCREPGSFLAFALYKLRHAFKQERHARKSGVPLPEDEASTAQADDETHTAPPRAPEREPGSGLPESAPDRELLSEERVLGLVQAVERLPDGRERAVVLWRFFGGMSDEEIAAQLGIKPGHVRVLRHRGLASLRADPVLRELL